MSYCKLFRERKLVGLGLLLLISFFVRWPLLQSVDIINVDAIRYFNSAHELMQGNLSAAFEHEKMLAYSLLLGVIHAVVDDWAFSGIFISMLFLSLTLFPLYFLTKEVFGNMAALWAGAALILLPAANSLSTQVAKDTVFLFFLMLALWLGRKGMVERKPACFLMTFLCAAMAALFRFEAVLFLAVYSLWLLSRWLFSADDRAIAKTGLIYYLAVPVISLCTILGIFVSGAYDVDIVNNVWSRFSKHYLYVDVLGSYFSIYNHLKSVERSFPGGQWSSDFFEIARHNLLLLYFIGLLQKLLAALFPVYIVPLYFGVKGVQARGRNLGLLVWAILAYLGMAYFFLLTRNFLAERYLMIVVVMLLPFTGHGFEQLRNRLALTRWPKTALAVVVIFFVCLPLYKSFEDVHYEKLELRLAGEWLQEHQDVMTQRMIVNDERIPFYAGLMRGSYDYIPDGEGQDFESLATASGDALLALYVSFREEEALPAFANYQLIEKFRGDKKVVLVYAASP